MKKTMALMAVIILTTGCDMNLVVGGAKRAENAVPIVSDAADKAVNAVETATGKTVVSPEFAEKAGNVAGKIEAGTGIAETGAEIITGFLPEEKKVYGQALIALLGLTNISAAAVAAWFNKRKNAALKTAVLAADETSGGGAALVSAAVKTGLSVEVATTHEKLKSSLET